LAPELPDQLWANIAQTVSAVALAAGAVLAWRTVRAARESSRRDATYRYLERHDFGEGAAIILAAATIWTLKKSEIPKDGIARYDALSEEVKTQVWRAFNFYEEISLFYLSEHFAQSAFRELLAPLLMQDWRDAHWLVTWLRTRDDGTVDRGVWSHWQTAYCKMLREGVPFNDSREDTDPNDGCPPEARYDPRLYLSGCP
jgi:hypothetical protein